MIVAALPIRGHRKPKVQPSSLTNFFYYDLVDTHRVGVGTLAQLDFS